MDTLKRFVLLMAAFACLVGCDKKAPHAARSFTIDATNFSSQEGVVISSPGKYVVSSNLIYLGNGYAFTIDADDVVIDFQGHMLDLQSKGNNGILVKAGHEDITITNGSILNTGHTPTPMCDFNSLVRPTNVAPWLAMTNFYRWGDVYGNYVEPFITVYPKETVGNYSTDKALLTALGVDPSLAGRPLAGTTIDWSTGRPPPFGSQAPVGGFSNTSTLPAIFVNYDAKWRTQVPEGYRTPPPVVSTAIELSGTASVIISKMTFDNCYVCIDAINAPVKSLLVENCVANNFGRKIKNATNYPGTAEWFTEAFYGLPIPPPEIPELDVDGPDDENIEFFGMFLNLQTRESRGNPWSSPNIDINIRNNILESSQAGFGIIVMPGRNVNIENNISRIPVNHDGWERNESWHVTVQNAEDVNVRNNLFYYGMHAISAFSVNSINFEGNRFFGSAEQGSLWQSVNGFVIRNNIFSQAVLQHKYPFNGSTNVAVTNAATGCNRIGMDPSGNTIFGVQAALTATAALPLKSIPSAAPGTVGIHPAATAPVWYYRVLSDGSYVPFTGPQESVRNVAWVDHAEGYALGSIKNGLFENNTVIGWNSPFTDSIAFSLIATTVRLVDGSKFSTNIVFRNNTAINCRTGFSSSTSGVVTSINATSPYPAGKNPAQVGAGVNSISDPSVIYYGNSAFNNGWVVTPSPKNIHGIAVDGVTPIFIPGNWVGNRNPPSVETPFNMHSIETLPSAAPAARQNLTN